ncbi:SWIM zinc finger family protein [Cytobacillus purgationiresistens]|uniref:SWIM-type domain-containing protein n=1 Tax=Cytobacillus purgationiresistens TaxID=863449 RepID=A0ABU0AD91_9BACI|nr:SWIM zinc finger family protein [Cytobacillus purgationiresistens]MDQ0269221.1 hypothetical protein [Cytobacillus purgationiresistens]
MEMLIPERFLEGLEDVSAKLLEDLDPNVDETNRLVQKGWILFRQGLVSQVKFNDTTIHAVVQDVTPAKVSLNFDFFTFSKCSCPTETLCRHQLAVFFHLLAKKNSVSKWMEEWRRPLKEKKDAKEWGLMRAKDLIKDKAQMEPDYDRWIESFSQSFKQLMQQQQKSNPKPYVIPELFSIYLKRINASSPMEKEWKLLYQLTCYTHSFQMLEELALELGHSKGDIYRYYLHLFQNLLDDSIAVMEKLAVHSLPFAFDTFIARMKDRSIQQLTGDFILEYERIELYRSMWTHFFKHKEWREEEIQKLGELAVKDTEQPLPILIGKSHLHILLREDHLALELLANLDGKIAPYFTFWVRHFTTNKEWQRAEPYIEMLIQKTRSYLKAEKDDYHCMDFTGHIIKSISSFCTNRNRMDLYEKALNETLPYSFNDYEQFLFDIRAFEKWADLQALIGLGITEIPKDRIKAIETHEPDLLLPLYHYSIQKDINMKNRDHYRQAVRKMKKLRTIYKKIKQTEQWEQFLEELLEKTKRLRAFQEECKRGKLIHA